MKKIILVIFLLLCVSACKNNDIPNIEKEDNYMENIRVIINDNSYDFIMENNETSKEFLKLLPKEFDMNELNNNEKYIYLDNTLKTNPIKINHINAGDVMIYQNDCLVIFYKSFDTSYSYTKIGHINNLPDLGNKNILVKFITS